MGGHPVFNISATTVGAVLAVVLLSLIHYHSLRLGKGVQGFLTAFKVGCILLFGVGGLAWGHGDSERLARLMPQVSSSFDVTALAVSLIFVSFAYSGWNAAAYLGGEIRRPERNLPLSLMIGTVLVTLLYLLLNTVYLYALPPERMSGTLEVGSEAATALFGARLGRIVGLALAVGLLSVLSAMIMSGPRVYYAMARDGLFFCRFGIIDADHRTPAQAIVFQAAIAVVMILSAAFDTLLIYIGFTLSLSAMLTVAGLIRLRVTHPHLPRPYRVWGYPVTPILFIAGNLWIVGHSLYSRPVAA